MPDPKRGIPAVCDAVTAAATLLSMLRERQGPLEDRDRRNCAQVLALLEKAERVLYGHLEE